MNEKCGKEIERKESWKHYLSQRIGFWNFVREIQNEKWRKKKLVLNTQIVYKENALKQIGKDD